MVNAQYTRERGKAGYKKGVNTWWWWGREMHRACGGRYAANKCGMICATNRKKRVADESADGKHGTCGMTNHLGMQCVANEQIVKLKSHTKLSPNFQTLPENLRRGQIVGDTSSQHFSQSTSSKYVHCSALIVTDVGRNMGGGLHLPHSPKLLARQLAKRRGIPRNSRCKKEYGCP